MAMAISRNEKEIVIDVSCSTDASHEGGNSIIIVVNITATVIVTINGTAIRTAEKEVNGKRDWGDGLCTILDHGLPERWTNAENNCDHDILVTRHQEENSIIGVPYLRIIRIYNRRNKPTINTASESQLYQL